jgi:hypothetical protein
LGVQVTARFGGDEQVLGWGEELERWLQGEPGGAA